jgi:uncharacterized protein (DUF4415 family)
LPPRGGFAGGISGGGFVAQRPWVVAGGLDHAEDRTISGALYLCPGTVLLLKHPRFADVPNRDSEMTRRISDPRERAEAAFKQATAKPPPAPLAKPPAVPGAREQVSLRLDRDVLDHFQGDGPGWQERINAALRKAAGL